MDPAAVPELALTPPVDKGCRCVRFPQGKACKGRTHRGRSIMYPCAPRASAKASCCSVHAAPASASLPPLSAAGAGSAPTANTVAGADSPYSAAAACPVGGVGGSAALTLAWRVLTFKGLNGQAFGGQVPCLCQPFLPRMFCPAPMPGPER